MSSDPTPSDAPKKQPSAFVPGTNVNAKIGKDDRGPFYLVQIEGDQAILQGSKTLTVPVSDLREIKRD